MTEELLETIKREFKNGSKHFTDAQKVDNAIYEHISEIKMDETNKVFNYVGATTNTAYFTHYVSKDDPDAHNILYWDIEQTYMISIPKEQKEEFERKNTIVYGRQQDITHDFFEAAIKTNQQEAVIKIVKKYGKK